MATMTVPPAVASTTGAVAAAASTSLMFGAGGVITGFSTVEAAKETGTVDTVVTDDTKAGVLIKDDKSSGAAGQKSGNYEGAHAVLAFGVAVLASCVLLR